LFSDGDPGHERTLDRKMGSDQSGARSFAGRRLLAVRHSSAVKFFEQHEELIDLALWQRVSLTFGVVVKVVIPTTTNRSAIVDHELPLALCVR
jgi:hypothetical protein